MHADTDVIVIGAGPAGLTAAKILAQSNVDYILIDRAEKPGEKKPCGGFIPQPTVKQFSIPKIEGYQPINAIRIKFPGIELVTIQFNEPLGINLSRDALAKSLLDQIQENKGRLMLGTNVESMSIDSACSTVTIRKDDDVSTLKSRLIIDASGANPVSQRFVPLRERISNKQMGYGLQYHIKVEGNFGNSNSFLYGHEYSPDGYCWIFPRGNTVIVGTGGLVERVRKNEKRTHEYIDHLLKRVEPFRSELSGGEIIKKDSALMPLCGIIRPSYGKRILLAGDAAGHCSPISGEGIHYSMVGGKCAAMAAIRCVKNGDFSDKALSVYEKKWTQEIGSDLKWGLWLQWKLIRPRSKGGTGGWTRSGFIDSEKSQKVIVEMLTGRRSVRNAILRSAPGYLKSKLFGS